MYSLIRDKITYDKGINGLIVEEPNKWRNTYFLGDYHRKRSVIPRRNALLFLINCKYLYLYTYSTSEENFYARLELNKKWRKIYL